jgi:hypothetical protein
MFKKSLIRLGHTLMKKRFCHSVIPNVLVFFYKQVLKQPLSEKINAERAAKKLILVPW